MREGTEVRSVRTFNQLLQTPQKSPQKKCKHEAKCHIPASGFIHSPKFLFVYRLQSHKTCNIDIYSLFSVCHFYCYDHCYSFCPHKHYAAFIINGQLWKMGSYLSTHSCGLCISHSTTTPSLSLCSGMAAILMSWPSPARDDPTLVSSGKSFCCVGWTLPNIIISSFCAFQL